jgi:hypothetical protein
MLGRGKPVALDATEFVRVVAVGRILPILQGKNPLLLQVVCTDREEWV